MTFAVLALALAAAAQPDPLAAGDSLSPRRYSGAGGETAVSIPRVEEADLRIDGVLDEAEWAGAALLTDFTQFAPAEGIPATERTEVRLFYTPQALYVGIHALARDPALLRATLADRDAIGRDDHVHLVLDTFLDRRRAFVLSVNPLGIQQDGILNEAGGGMGGDDVDLSLDVIWDSRGRVTDDGFVVELRIPFKSLKYPAGDRQRWGVNVVRQIAATGAEEAWAPISRSTASRLAQSGTLEGIHQLRPGRLLEINPVATGRREGAVRDGQFVRESFEPDLGANLKFGVTSDLTLDVTFNPDFSQVEADAEQITTNQRFAIFYDEKRPFFLEGADLFSTPQRLVHTRAIVDPITGAKLTGKVGGVSLAYLGAVDESPIHGGDSGWAPDPGRALFNIARFQRDLGRSVVGALVTDREAAGEYNRVAAVDGRIYFRDVYFWEFQLAQAWTRLWTPDAAGTDFVALGQDSVPVARTAHAGHLFTTAIDRTGRNFGFLARITDVPDDFHAHSGFLERTGVTDMMLHARHTRYGRPGGLLESWNVRVRGNRLYEGRDFWRGRDAAEGDFGLEVGADLRGNTELSLEWSRGFFVLDPARYADFVFVDADGRVVSGAELVGPAAEMRGMDDFSARVESAYFKSVSAELRAGVGETPIFVEGTRGREWEVGAELLLRPTDALRVEAELDYARIHRQRDGSLYSEALVPRLKAEYQLNRAMFVRATGQYSVEEVDVLRAPTGDPYRFEGAPFRLRGGERLHPELLQTNPLRMDLLFSYQPTPGTVVFLGYGRQMDDRGAYRFSSLDPRSDGLFMKLSYRFRS